MYDMTVFNAVQCERGAGHHLVKGVPYGRVGVRCEHHQIFSQLVLKRVRGMLAQ